MNDAHRRWFEPPSIKASVAYMFDKCQRVPAGQLDDVRDQRDQQQMKTALIAGGGALAFLVVVIASLLLFAKPVDGKKPQYGRLALICLTVVGGAGAGVFYVCGNNNQKRAARDTAFEELCQRFPGLRSAGHKEIVGDGVGSVPWFISEEWIHAYGLASGEYQGEEIVVVECTHVVDPILTTTDSKLLQGLSGLVSKKHQRLHLRAMEATVFVEPLEHVSDLVFVPQMDASRAYYKRALSSQDCDLSEVFKLPRSLRSKYWMAAAAPEECGELFATNLPTLLTKRKWCIVQVVGGHCVVMTNQWHGNRPSQAPKTEAAIAENLEFAHAVYQELQRYSSAPTPAAPATTHTDQVTAMPVQETPFPATSVTRATAAPTALKRQGSRRPHSLFVKFLLFGFGLPLFLIGLLITLGIWMGVNQGRAARNWPQVDAAIVNSRIDVINSRRFAPLVAYEYEVDGQKFTNDRIQHGPTNRTRDKREVERTLAKYPQGAVVKAFYNPDRPHRSVLVPGVNGESEMFGFLIFSGSLIAVGSLMCGYGAMGRKRKTAVNH
ncbi:MAG: DUF3592 domain-containing protein [Pirellulales bacterium]